VLLLRLKQTKKYQKHIARCREFQGQGLGIIVWAFAKIGYDTSKIQDLLERFAQEAIDRLSGNAHEVPPPPLSSHASVRYRLQACGKPLALFGVVLGFAAPPSVAAAGRMQRVSLPSKLLFASSAPCSPLGMAASHRTAVGCAKSMLESVGAALRRFASHGESVSVYTRRSSRVGGAEP
jgi:hypothetical protein